MSECDHRHARVFGVLDRGQELFGPVRCPCGREWMSAHEYIHTTGNALRLWAEKGGER